MSLYCAFMFIYIIKDLVLEVWQAIKYIKKNTSVRKKLAAIKNCDVVLIVFFRT